jgi:hypothetical protein
MTGVGKVTDEVGAEGLAQPASSRVKPRQAMPTTLEVSFKDVL